MSSATRWPPLSPTPHTFPTIIAPCTLPSKVLATAAHDQLDLELHNPQHCATVGTFGSVLAVHGERKGLENKNTD
jgi:hypothetical protein